MHRPNHYRPPTRQRIPVTVGCPARGLLIPDFHFNFGSANLSTASDSLIYAGLKARKALRRSTPGLRAATHRYCEMGEKENKPFQLTFNGFLKVDFQGSRVTSDGGLILIRALDEREQRTPQYDSS